ncbi:MAG: hypothetical protein GY723_09415 [bacterium]|nr:hypothetical protein [bacterium]MCP5070134.1 hypothetical protein [bacterium]
MKPDPARETPSARAVLSFVLGAALLAGCFAAGRFWDGDPRVSVAVLSATFWAAAVVYYKRRDAQDETPEHDEANDAREALIVRLQQEIDRIETLRGIVPICAQCKNVRREDGAWERIEAFIEAHSQADFSHGLCDECLSEHHL